MKMKILKEVVEYLTAIGIGVAWLWVILTY